MAPIPSVDAGTAPTPGALPGGGAGGSFDFNTLSPYSPSQSLLDIDVPIRRTDKKLGAPEPWSGGMEYEVEKLKYQEAMMSMYKSDPESLSGLQKELAAGGWMGKNPNFIDKAPDDVTRNAWDEVLRAAIGSGRTVKEIMDEAIEANGGLEEGLKKFGIGGDGDREQSDISVTHPDDIRMTAKEVSRKVLGKSWSNTQIDAFVKAYQAQEIGAGTAARADGATYTQPASMEAAAEAQARRSNPAQAGATDWVNAGNLIIEAFKTLGGGGVPNG